MADLEKMKAKAVTAASVFKERQVGKLAEFTEHDRRALEFAKGVLATSIEHQLLIFCIRQEDLLVLPEVYMRELLLGEDDFDHKDRLAAMEKPR
ncbi:hypothetical protein [Marinobacter sp. ATCH36]|uniref:hypothetical protein n=1 Tax=Marinobacter sp. ATCH36 TaxID=2945106 RepID=UPI0020212040|nr:hypothetical protein [Marinobacter sp. ATCH36]MCL7944054.1 hypothetical protein [Marinobacter sp. ATCH36]